MNKSNWKDRNQTKKINKDEEKKCKTKHYDILKTTKLFMLGIFNKPYKIPNEHQNTLCQIIKRF